MKNKQSLRSDELKQSLRSMDLKTLAVIGSNGMIGSDLVRYLKQDFKELTEIDRDNYDDYKGKEFDVIINANGNSNKIWANENRFGDFEASTASVYKTLLDFSCKKYIYISSSDVYENHSSEKTTSETESINPDGLTPYGLHKFLGECIVKNFAGDYIILRCPMMLGTNLKKEPIYDILSNSRLFISGNSAFQMITTKELAHIILSLLKKDASKEIFNVGGKGNVRLSEIEKLLKRVVNFPKDGKIQVYETNVIKLNELYPLKTSSEYLEEFLKTHTANKQ